MHARTAPPKTPPPKIQTIAQKRPASLAVGSVLYTAAAHYDDDTRRVSTELKEWHVSSIKRKRADDAAPTVYLVCKVEGVTWGKLSKKTGDYGWLPSIPPECRDSFIQGEYLGSGFATTQEKAFSLAVGQSKHKINRYKNWDSEPGSIGFSENIEACLIEIEALERRLKKYATKRKTAKADKIVAKESALVASGESSILLAP